MLYCPPNITLAQIWVNHGISHCFMDTISTSITGGFLLFFGTIQLLIYRKYATRIEDLSQISNSRLYKLQIFLLCFVPLLCLTRFILLGFVYKDATIYGYMVIILLFSLKK